MTRLHWIWLVVRHAAVAAVLGGAIVVLPLGLNLFAFVVSVGLLLRSSWKLERSLAFPTVLSQVTVLTLLVVAAINAPIKTSQRFLERTIELPKKVVTLAEIQGEPDGLPPEWCPRSVHIQVPLDERPKEVVFSSTTITLREFVNALESQSTMRHRFSHCGNGSTILWGGDCSFGMHLRRPRE